LYNIIVVVSGIGRPAACSFMEKLVMDKVIDIVLVGSKPTDHIEQLL